MARRRRTLGSARERSFMDAGGYWWLVGIGAATAGAYWWFIVRPRPPQV